MAKARRNPDPYGFRKEFDDLLRGLAGGVIFGMPLLYTMEVWHRGMTFSSLHLLLLLIAILFINILFCYLSGLREGNSFSWSGAINDGITATALGGLLSTVVMMIIHRINWQEDSLQNSLGKILLEAVVVSIGINFTNSQISNSQDQRSQGKNDKSHDQESHGQQSQKQVTLDLKNLLATIIGSTVFAANVAPTEEVVKIAISLSPGGGLMLLFSELVFVYLILFASGLRPHRVFTEGSLLQSPISEVVMCLAVSLLTSAALLFAVGFPETKSHIEILIYSTIALGLPASVGGAAGRLIV